jgi:hypothetical protein
MADWHLAPRAASALEAMRRHPDRAWRSRDVRAITGRSYYATKKAMAELRDLGIIERIGRTKGATWRIQ